VCHCLAASHDHSSCEVVTGSQAVAHSVTLGKTRSQLSFVFSLFAISFTIGKL